MFSVVVGSPNLSFLFTKKMKKPKQYELAMYTNHPRPLWRAKIHIERLKLKAFSDNVVELEKYKTVTRKREDTKVKEKGERVNYKKSP